MIRYDMPEGEYHAHTARSKSDLWKLYANTPNRDHNSRRRL